MAAEQRLAGRVVRERPAAVEDDIAAAVLVELQNIENDRAILRRRGLLRQHDLARRQALRQILSEDALDHVVERADPAVLIADIEMPGRRLLHQLLAVESGRNMHGRDLHRHAGDRRPRCPGRNRMERIILRRRTRAAAGQQQPKYKTEPPRDHCRPRPLMSASGCSSR
ncbi:MAG TPA: hypothetical protein VKV32_11495 [Stellaceae bacterium]|nr:hypothetical protein [Stellaceae bacterium]